MKLANSWTEEAPTAVPSEQLYDESEEYDEVDESKDGCVGVQWRKCVLNKSRTSDTILFDLAREVRGIEQRRGKSLTVTQYKAICDKWEDASRRFFRKGHDYFPEFLAKLDRVTMPKASFEVDFFFMGSVWSYSFLFPLAWFFVIAGPAETKNRAG